MRQRAKLFLSALAMTLVAAVSAIVIPQIANAGVSGPVGNGPMVFQSGTYTPIISNTTNVDTTSSVAHPATYTRIGDVVTVSGVAKVVVNSPTGLVSLNLSLPIASDMTASTDLNGQANGATGALSPFNNTSTGTWQQAQFGTHAYVMANHSNDSADLWWWNYSNYGPSFPADYHYTFSYVVK